MLLYKTVAGRAQAEQEIEKSRFIAYIAPVSSKEEGDAFIAEIRAKHKDATHNVPAMVVGDKMQIQWASDDGEPQGTSGAPMVQLLTGMELTNVCIVVTRYFGGTKLGTGGLVRAYSSSARLAVEAARIREVKEMTVADISIEYTHLAKLQNVARERGWLIEDEVYEDKVKMKLICASEEADTMMKMLAEITAGSCVVAGCSEEAR
jgi:uncharacterized YigZ family protein